MSPLYIPVILLWHVPLKAVHQNNCRHRELAIEVNTCRQLWGCKCIAIIIRCNLCTCSPSLWHCMICVHNVLSLQFPHTGPASGSKRGGAGDLSQSLKRSTESDVFQRFYAEMNSSITDPDQFAAELIQHKFTTKQTADNKMPSGIPNYRKVGNLLGIVDSHIRSVSSVTPERVKERFIILLLILRNKLGLDGLAQKMETECCMWMLISLSMTIFLMSRWHPARACNSQRSTEWFKWWAIKSTIYWPWRFYAQNTSFVNVIVDDPYRIKIMRKIKFQFSVYSISLVGTLAHSVHCLDVIIGFFMFHLAENALFISYDVTFWSPLQPSMINKSDSYGSFLETEEWVCLAIAPAYRTTDTLVVFVK